MITAPPTPREPPHASVSSRNTRTSLATRVAVGAVLAIVVASLLALFGDVREIGSALRAFPWWLLLPVLGLTVWNYALRFLKWQLYLHRLGIDGLPTSTSALVYLSGFAMSITPGKVGELIKSVWLQRFTGAPINRTSAIVAAERLTDAFAMLVLAGIGATQFAFGRTLLAFAAVGGAIVVGLVLQRRFLLALVARAEHWRGVGRFVAHAVAFLDASHDLLKPRLLATAVSLGVLSWAGECVAFWLILGGLDLPLTAHLLLVATFVLAVSSIAGALSLLPGGLGVADASVAGMLILLVTDERMSRGVAAAATLLIRFATLWFAVLLGALALALLQRRWRLRERAVPASVRGPALPVVQNGVRSNARDRLSNPSGGGNR